MNETPIIIIGAGAAGLIAARELLRRQKKIIILEASERIGGRIHTISGQSATLEAGAEFVHGNLPLTIGLLKEYNISYYATGGEMIQIENGKIKEQHDFIKGWDILLKEMGSIKTDMTFSDFLTTHFTEKKYETLRASARRFAEGFDVANIDKVSTFALYEEWSGEDEEDQYRIVGGYQKIIDALYQECLSLGAIIHTDQIVKEVHWEKDNVKLYTKQGQEFAGEKILITVPLGILQADPGQAGSISFIPSIEPQLRAAGQIGFGSVIKILFECKSAFWEKKAADMGFLFTNEIIPTWWTQLPVNDNVLTGWIAGPLAAGMQGKTNDMILEIAQQSLENSFGFSIKQEIIKGNIFNWCSDPYSLGAYSYPMLQTREARKLLNLPVDDILFFSGEALYDGPNGGTVEAALVNGLEAAKKILK